MTSVPPAVAIAFERVTVEDVSQVPSARSLAVRVALTAGIATVGVDRIALVATELAANLCGHAVQGELLVGCPGGADGSARRLVLIALDRGPGVENFERCLVDGFTTAGTMGTGLGAVRRLAADFDAVSEPGRGTVVCAGFPVPGAATSARMPFDVGALGFPIAGEIENGDAYAVVQRPGRVQVMLADGLGHGPLAAVASGAAAEAFVGSAGQGPGASLTAINEQIAGTRGAAVSIASLDVAAARGGGAIVTSGFGNVSMVVAAPEGRTKRLVTSHGTAGARRGARVSEVTADFPGHGTFILHSDGLTSRWTLEDRAALLRHSSQAVAAALWRDHARGSDDTMIVVVKVERAAPAVGAG